MSKYIDAEKLIAEIKRYIKHYEKLNRDEFKNGELYICQELLSFIKSLQQEQPEVDLEVRKQIEELANDWHHKGFASDEDCPLCMQDLIDILWYFYELGLKARKED